MRWAMSRIDFGLPLRGSGEQLIPMRYLQLSRNTHAGRLAVTPPSTYVLPFMTTGLNMMGMLHDADTHSAISPLEKAAFE